MIKYFFQKHCPKKIWDYLKREKYRYNFKTHFYNVHGYNVNIEQPITWNDKIHFRKKYGNQILMAKLADKVEVRSFVSDKIGKEYLTKVIQIVDTASDINFDLLPNKFVIKTNHGSGPEHIEIVTDKTALSKERIIEKFSQALMSTHGYIHDEKFYSYIKPKIIIEEYLDSGKITPDDFKLHCFNKDGNFVCYIQVDSGRYISHQRNIYDVDWNLQPFKIEKKYPHINEVKRPNELDEMLAIAKKLSSGFDYIRVDLYVVDSKIYFGELTFTHGDGMECFEPTDIDYKWGELWDLSVTNKELYDID
ncbi:ATP-grasp fold amidoligase family protein [Vibrio sp. Vb2853]|uniref:ATP-grasp fold amidoligase family protein n=1 Tax=Vibrio TaxID=662 RepID=UPI001BD1BDE7|nr:MULTISPECIES: ATP-grasp fold amidoligase family protein [unclassified Vibrio]MBS9892362.1 hypothetical protein [Vibrio alginolyticus]MDW1613610.1 ATP-grasp fold amidoligase family protein [Vibrio sp. Vb2881]MDW1618326.1 ATP-grasp fold amidoligase family protein [Vibrio sp. Vb2864]MDW1690563.1 ATP-grasp fold amidoligase family protein [Vibrio sp. Vb2853]MDW1709170.1 ATP-grasp fold amidoligase family protein [Vibrio sp. Vb2865]